MRRNTRSEQKSTSSLKKMTMLALNNTILGMSTRTRKLSKSAMLRENLPKRLKGRRDNDSLE
ncbi:hypothetical protein C2845_PM11G18030 [Panicum miliaceum]|uniref:Uncharacterized protein n=1 Tax=Panicum miliaceum TaxID=4540 RepID=A0A3L6RS07_PANMI|nr:hypothetical protein C2845_PM11G18030 [Panicum miliaceum]